MNKDLQELYAARELGRKADLVSDYNDSINKAMRAKTQVVEKESNRKVKKLENKCNALGNAHRFATRFLPVLAIVLALLIGYVVLAQTALSDYLFLDFDSFVAEARAYAIENADSFPDLLIGAKLRDNTAERIAYFNSEVFEVDCYAFLTGSIFWMTVGVFLIAAMCNRDDISLGILILDILLILAMTIGLMVKVKTIIGILIGVIWMSFTGIPMMWNCGVPLMISFAVVHLIVITGFTIYNGLAKKHKANVVPKMEKVKAWKAEIAAEKAACKKKCEQIEKPYKAKLRNYPKGYGQHPSFMYNYATASQLIWAIENRYAKDIESARCFLDQKARDAAMQRQLNEIYREAQAAHQAARAAEAAAREPVEVNITVW